MWYSSPSASSSSWTQPHSPTAPVTDQTSMSNSSTGSRASAQRLGCSLSILLKSRGCMLIASVMRGVGLHGRRGLCYFWGLHCWRGVWRGVWLVSILYPCFYSILSVFHSLSCLWCIGIPFWLTSLSRRSWSSNTSSSSIRCRRFISESPMSLRMV